MKKLLELGAKMLRPNEIENNAKRVIRVQQHVHVRLYQRLFERLYSLETKPKPDPKYDHDKQKVQISQDQHDADVGVFFQFLVKNALGEATRVGSCQPLSVVGLDFFELDYDQNGARAHANKRNNREYGQIGPEPRVRDKILVQRVFLGNAHEYFVLGRAKIASIFFKCV